MHLLHTRHRAKPFTFFIYSSQPSEIASIIIPILQMKKLRFKGINLPKNMQWVRDRNRTRDLLKYSVCHILLMISRDAVPSKTE